MQGISKPIAVCLIGMFLLAGCAMYSPSPETLGELADPLKSLAAIERNFEKREGAWPCAYSTSKRDGAAQVSLSGSQFHIACENGKQVILRYRDIPDPTVLIPGSYFELPRSAGGYGNMSWENSESAREFVTGWYVLAHPGKPQDPATDSLFRDAVARDRRENKDRTENLRRVQVRAESAIKAHRMTEAGMAYSEALKIAPAWPEGHFNLALIYGDLELYADAITEMKRYVYLVPTAPDARAAQDKIYEWELKAK